MMISPYHLKLYLFEVVLGEIACFVIDDVKAHATSSSVGNLIFRIISRILKMEGEINDSASSNSVCIRNGLDSVKL